MAGNLQAHSAGVDEIALTAGVTKTVMQINASTFRVKVRRIGIFFDGKSTTAEPIQIRFVRQDYASGDDCFKNALDRSSSNSTLVGCGGEPTPEPASSDVVDSFECHPQRGIDIRYRRGEEICIPVNANLGIEVTSPANVNCKVIIITEE